MKRVKYSALAIVSALAFHAFASTITIDGVTWTYFEWNGHASIGGGASASLAVPKSTVGTLIIPSVLGYWPVTEVGRCAFHDCSMLTSVTIPEGVTTIRESAFAGCSGLTSVTIPSTVTSIESSAFAGCSRLTSVTIPSSVTSIGSSAFAGCIGLTSVTISEGVTRIGSCAFYNCSELTSVTIPSSVTSIGSSAFKGCSGLTSVTIQEGVTSIGGDAFSGCSGLTSVTIPSSVVKIDNYAFDCSSLMAVNVCDISAWCAIEFPSDVANPLYYAKKLYQNGAEILDLIVPENVERIGKHAFSGCSGLTSVTIPSSVTSIGSYAFSGCGSVRSFAVALDNPCYQSVNGMLCTKDGMRLLAGINDNVIIPESVTTIESRAFDGCDKMTSLEIPSSVTSIGPGAFSGCSGLTSITLPFVGSKRGNTGSGDAQFGFIFGTESYAGSTAVKQIYGWREEEWWKYYIPSSLKSVVVLDETTIGYGAFYNCVGIESLTLPSSVTSIDNYAFYNCSGLKSLTMSANVRGGGSVLFGGCEGLADADGFIVIGDVLRGYLGSASAITIPKGVRHIADNVFWRCTGLKSVSIPEGVETIGDSAFHHCENLASVTIPESVTRIGKWAFSDTKLLRDSARPNEFVVIGGCLIAYNGNDAVPLELVVPDDVRVIADEVFKDFCISSVTIPASVTSIGEDAFCVYAGYPTAVNVTDLAKWCKISFDGWFANPLYEANHLYLNGEEVKDLAIPEGVTSIGNYAFI